MVYIQAMDIGAAPELIPPDPYDLDISVRQWNSSCWFVANADVVDKDVEPKFWILSLAELKSISAAYLSR